MAETGWVMVGADPSEVTTATSGNCCLKSASKSSPGFCELVLIQTIMLANHVVFGEGTRDIQPSRACI